MAKTDISRLAHQSAAAAASPAPYTAARL